MLQCARNVSIAVGYGLPVLSAFLRDAPRVRLEKPSIIERNCLRYKDKRLEAHGLYDPQSCPGL